MTDIYEIFDNAVRVSETKSEQIDNADSHDPYYDLDKFLSYLESSGEQLRVLSLARLIIKTQCDDDPGEFLSAVSEMVQDVSEQSVTIMVHGYGNLEINGDIPENCQLTMKPPPLEPEYGPAESWHLRSGK